MANVNFMRGDTEKMDNTAIMDGLIFFNTEENEMFLDDGNTRKQFSGAGHIIENNAGTDMAKRRNMQFKGAYVEDDSENNRTKVNVIRKMTDTEFSQLTEAEKQGIIKTTTDNNLPFDATMVEYDNTQSDLSSTTVQGAIDELNSDLTKAKFITATSTTLSSNSGALGGYVGGVTISSSDVPSTTYAIIPLGCHQSTDGNRSGVLRPQFNNPVNLTWFVNGGTPNTYNCMFIALYR